MTIGVRGVIHVRIGIQNRIGTQKNIAIQTQMLTSTLTIQTMCYHLQQKTESEKSSDSDMIIYFFVV